MWNKVWKISSLKYIAAFLIPLIFTMFMCQGLDNDSWDVLAEGRYIVENGVYYTDVLSMHEGLNITVQNYGFAVIFYLIFNTFGAAGIYVVMLILDFLICYLLYKICMLVSNKNVNLSLLIMVITNFVLALGFVTTRAQMVSYVIFLGLIYVLELYIKTDKAKYLWWLPVLSLLQINLHASLWWMLILVMLVYIIDSIKKPKLHLQGYRTKPLIVASLMMVLFGLINPYGLDMITFIFKSYGDARFNNLIVELKPFSPFRDVFSIVVYISLVGVLSLYIFGERKNVRIRYLLMFFGFLALGLNTIKGLSQLILTMFFPLALLYKNVRLEKIIEAKIGRDAILIWGGTIVLLSFVVTSLLIIGQIKSCPSDELVGMMDAIETDAGEQDKTKLRVYAGYGDGSYVEYRGYRPYIDPRGEVFLKKNNGKEDILYEWIDFEDGGIKVLDFLEKYNFDYIISRSDDPFYDFESDSYGYEMIFKDEENGLEVFGKRKELFELEAD